MKAIVTKVTQIVGKDAREWTKVDFVSLDGEAGSCMYEKGKYPIPKIGIEADELSTYPTVEVEFNQRGRLVSLE